MAAADSTRLRALIDSLEVASEEFEKKEEYDFGLPFLLDLVNCITDDQADFVIKALEWEKDEIRWQGDPESGFADVFLRVNRSFLYETEDAIDPCKKEFAALSARKVPTAPLFFLLAEAYLATNEKLETNAGDKVNAKVALVEERRELLAQLKQMEESHDRLNKAVADVRDAIAECLPVLKIDSRKEQALGGQQNQRAADLLEVWQVPVKVDTARRWLNRRDKEEPM